jgi:hypothetical protein
VLDALEFRVVRREVADRAIRPKLDQETAGVLFIGPNVPDCGLVGVVQFDKFACFVNQKADRIAVLKAVSCLVQEPFVLGVPFSEADRKAGWKDNLGATVTR